MEVEALDVPSSEISFCTWESPGAPRGYYQTVTDPDLITLYEVMRGLHGRPKPDRELNILSSRHYNQKHRESLSRRQRDLYYNPSRMPSEWENV